MSIANKLLIGTYNPIPTPLLPVYDDILNERADRTFTSPYIHSKQSVQTLRVLGRCNTC